MAIGTLAPPPRIINCNLHCRKTAVDVALDCLGRVFSQLPAVSILGGNASKANADGFTYWAAKPKEVFEFRSGGAGHPLADQKDPFGKLQRVLNKYRLIETRDDLPKGIFAGGWVGYFSYELGRYIERVSARAVDDLGLPLIRLCFYDRLIAYDHITGDFWLMALELPGDTESPQEKLNWLEGLLSQAKNTSAAVYAPGDLERIDLSQIRCNISRDYYFESLKKIRRYIYDGDVYQINFSQRFECDFNAQPINLFAWQNHYNPSPYAAYIDADEFQIVSASPEMFITIKNNVISTKPIKGTRPRIKDLSSNESRVNATNFDDLLRSEKEQAELNMIIDLERNDVARVCVPGTRYVSQPRTIETYPTVFHAVATVAGELREDVTFCDVLRAMFPGGSITGAPKIRAMEIIDELEPTARGVYTGAIGCIALDGSVSLNIAIRTIIIKGEKAFVQTGGGIVADSDPKAEYDETITKARALITGINAVCPGQNS